MSDGDGNGFVIGCDRSKRTGKYVFLESMVLPGRMS